MSSVALAQDLTRDLARLLAPSETWQRQITIIHNELTSERFSARLRTLTWNRVKSWFYAEARRIDYEEVVALQELKAMKEAQLEHRRFIAETNRLAILLAAEGASLSREQMAVLQRVAGGSLDVQSHHGPGAWTGMGRADQSGARV